MVEANRYVASNLHLFLTLGEPPWQFSGTSCGSKWSIPSMSLRIDNECFTLLVEAMEVMKVGLYRERARAHV